jgi:hypothetical protein
MISSIEHREHPIYIRGSEYNRFVQGLPMNTENLCRLHNPICQLDSGFKHTTSSLSIGDNIHQYLHIPSINPFTLLIGFLQPSAKVVARRAVTTFGGLRNAVSHH